MSDSDDDDDEFALAGTFPDSPGISERFQPPPNSPDAKSDRKQPSPATAAAPSGGRKAAKSAQPAEQPVVEGGDDATAAAASPSSAQTQRVHICAAKEVPCVAEEPVSEEPPKKKNCTRQQSAVSSVTCSSCGLTKEVHWLEGGRYTVDGDLFGVSCINLCSQCKYPTCKTCLVSDPLSPLRCVSCCPDLPALARH